MAYRDLSRKLQGRDIAQVMLFAPQPDQRVVAGRRDSPVQDKAGIVSPAEALADPVYQLNPTAPLPVKACCCRWRAA